MLMPLPNSRYNKSMNIQPFFLWVSCTIVGFLLLTIMTYVPFMWQHRKVWGEMVAALHLTALPFTSIASTDNIWIWWLVGAQLIGLLLACRLVFGRLPDAFLRHSTRLNVLIASIVGALLLGTYAISQIAMLATIPYIQDAGLALSAFAATVFAAQTVWTLEHFRLRLPAETSQTLPTVSLLIPARNETHALTDCLNAAIGSDYPKLEILALDDCSQDKTSEFIRAFAHDGVRFVQGDVPADGWLGKNQAYKTLSAAASGEYLLFIGVDTILSQQSTSLLVRYALANKLDMLTVLPQRRDGPSIATIFWQLRYYWQIVLPVTRRRVPVASQCWLIKASVLQAMGGFDAVRNKIVPEGWFARRLQSQKRYRFLVSNAQLGITTAKRWSSQNQSSLRFLYPTFKRQPLFALLAFCLLISLFLWPFIQFAVLTASRQHTNAWLANIGICAMLLFGYLLVVMRTIPQSWPITVLAFPFSLCIEAVLFITSMLAYEFGEVNWKGRNVCYPVLRAYSPQELKTALRSTK